MSVHPALRPARKSMKPCPASRAMVVSSRRHRPRKARSLVMVSVLLIGDGSCLLTTAVRAPTLSGGGVAGVQAYAGQPRAGARVVPAWSPADPDGSARGGEDTGADGVGFAVGRSRIGHVPLVLAGGPAGAEGRGMWPPV